MRQPEHPDPDRISTPEDLSAALDALRLRAGFQSKRSLTTATTHTDRNGVVVDVLLPKSTVDDALAGRGVPTDETLRTFVNVCGVTSENEIVLWLRAAERARRGDADRPDNAVRVSTADARLLGVHKSIAVAGATDYLPIYIDRDIDAGPTGVRAKVAAAAERGGFILLVGSSSVGKTRCAYEAIRDLLPDWWLVHPDSAAEVRDLATAPPQRTVVWLDEIQKYFDSDGLTAGPVQSLLTANNPVVLVGTLWPGFY